MHIDADNILLMMTNAVLCSRGPKLQSPGSPWPGFSLAGTLGGGSKKILIATVTFYNVHHKTEHLVFLSPLPHTEHTDSAHLVVCCCRTAFSLQIRQEAVMLNLSVCLSLNFLCSRSTFLEPSLFVYRFCSKAHVA